MYACHFAFAHRCNFNLGSIVGRNVYPAILAVKAGYDVVGKSYCRSARSILLVNVVYLLDTDIVIGKSVHQLRQTAIDCKCYIHAERIVRRINHRSSLCAAQLLQFGQPLRPTRSTAHYRRTRFDTGAYIVVGGKWRRKFYRHIDTSQTVGAKVGRIVLVDYKIDRVAPRKQHTLDFVSHFAVAYYCNFHGLISIRIEHRQRYSILQDLPNRIAS